jgi:hypothetical protein
MRALMFGWTGTTSGPAAALCTSNCTLSVGGRFWNMTALARCMLHLCSFYLCRLTAKHSPGGFWGPIRDSSANVFYFNLCGASRVNGTCLGTFCSLLCRC